MITIYHPVYECPCKTGLQARFTQPLQGVVSNADCASSISFQKITELGCGYT